MVTIEKAAIQYEGIVYVGWRHHLIGHQMLVDCVCPRPFPGGKAQGFVTSEGKFVSREEARQIAEKAHQGHLRPGYDELYSEDLWNMDGTPMHGCSTCGAFKLYSENGKVCPWMPCKGWNWREIGKNDRILTGNR
jgi:hypothetical protein